MALLKILIKKKNAAKKANTYDLDHGAGCNKWIVIHY